MAAVFLVVVVGAFIAYLATQSNVQQATSIEDFESARAVQAARAGLEWAGYQIQINGVACAGGACAGAGTTLTFAGTSLAEFTTTVSCSCDSLTEGANTVTVYRLTSNACNIPAAGPVCPNGGTTAATYVDRELSATIAK